MKMRKAIFLDRDGVINRDRGDYTFRIEDFELLHGTGTFIASMNERGYLVIIITNQGGISKGIYTHGSVEKLHDHMLKLLADLGARIDDIYYCPHHDINEKCLCRKPGSLMLEKAISRYGIDPARSYMIGDKNSDIMSAENVAVNGILVKQNSDLTSILDQIP